MMMTTLYFILSVFIVSVTAVEWYQKKNYHALRDTAKEDLEYWIGMSDETLFNQTLEEIAIPRVPGTNGHHVVRDYIRGSMEALQWNVKLDSFLDNTPVGELKFTNIIATFNDRAPRHLVLACHYDSKLDREKAMVLATDSAVPCAMMIYLAKLLDAHLRLQRPNSEDVSLQFIFFDGEEAFIQWSDTDSLYGARHLAKILERRRYPRGETTNHLQRMDVMVLLDLLGSKDPTFYSYFQETGYLFSKLHDIENNLHNMGLLVNHSTNYFVNAHINAMIEDDHIPFFRRGVRILHLIPQPFPEVWHQETDTVENLHFPTIENLNRILRVFIVQYLHIPLGEQML